jgi:ParB family transcriptional regulator, chromosome partitioning protein
LDESPAAFAEFLHNMRENGQQVPILVRPHPTQPGRYQFAYGRRRLRAVRELGRLVRAIVKPLTDAELVIAQGQENSQRKDLSFIERALYAADLEQNGQTRDTIMQALGIDKTGLSKLISVAEQIPHRIIRAIGPAPKAGRDRWLELAVRIKAAEAAQIVEDTLSSQAFLSLESDERFTSLFSAIAPKRAAKPRMKAWKAEDGTRAARFRQDEKGTTIVIDSKVAPEFGNYVLASLGDLYEAYRKAQKS